MQRTGHHNRHGYRGVFFDKGRAMFRARIDARWLGRFASAEDAARAYDEEARKIYGADARLNFPAYGEKGSVRSSVVVREVRQMATASEVPTPPVVDPPPPPQPRMSARGKEIVAHFARELALPDALAEIDEFVSALKTLRGVAVLMHGEPPVSEE